MYNFLIFGVFAAIGFFSLVPKTVWVSELFLKVKTSDFPFLKILFPFFIKEDFIGIIPAGTPIVQIIPVKRDFWEREYLKFDTKTSLVEIEKYLSTIKRSYKNKFWQRKSYK